MSKVNSLRVALVEAPFGPCAWPSIGTSLLKSTLKAHGHEAWVLYLNIEFLRRLGPPSLDTVKTYHDISDAFGVHLGEWIFGPAAFPNAPWEQLDSAFAKQLIGNSEHNLLQAALKLRVSVHGYIEDMAARFNNADFDVIGFANSYSQLNASIALARAIRKHRPDISMIMGGCSCAGERGRAIMDILPDIDAVVTSEADEVIVRLCEILVRKEPLDELGKLPGVLYRIGSTCTETARAPQRLTDLSNLSIPDYTDYYEFLPVELHDLLPHYIPIEASRGCWWGAKHHCTFCGLSSARMPYFYKSSQRFLFELQELTHRHRPVRFMVVDNIMPHKYHRSVVPYLSEVVGEAEVFLEVKANLNKNQIKLLAANRVKQLQPGIESLSTKVLKLMRKGTTGVANIYTLRLCQEQGIRVQWAILYGFDGESYEDYLLTTELIRRIQHLRAPLGFNLVQLERSSPMVVESERFGLSNLRPSRWYHYCFPVPSEILERLAYRFDADRSKEQCDLMREILLLVGPLVEKWQAAQAGDLHSLRLQAVDGAPVIIRGIGSWQLEYRLGRTAAELFAELDQPTLLDRIGISRKGGYISPYVDPELRSMLARIGNCNNDVVRIDTTDHEEAYLGMLAHGLIIEEEGRAVSVVLDSTAEKETGARWTIEKQSPNVPGPRS